jgi:3-oxoacyl-[acyl-carrier protein] reductase
MDLGLGGKGVIVTGGSRGIGAAIAQGFAREGASVSICARDAADLERARDRLASYGTIVHAQRCDVTDMAALEAYVAAAHEALGDLHVLVNNPSGFGLGDDEESWRKSLEVDVMALVRASRFAAPLIAASGGGSIVHISSISGMSRPSGSIAYGAAKAAVIHLTLSQAKALAPQSIRVNCVAPGSILFDDGFWDTVRRSDRRAFEAVVGEIAFGRMGAPEEVANAVVFLASQPAGWITGQTLGVDGGQMLS